MKKRQLIITLLMLAVILIILTPNSNAALQSNGATPTVQNLPSWLTSIRTMEGVGGALGLTETIDSSTLLSTSGSNNLDIHMEKNTEYGAIAILSASSYGNPNKIENGGTTTGNETGIVMNINKEWVAAGSLTRVPAFTNASTRYKDIYVGGVKYIREAPYGGLPGWTSATSKIEGANVLDSTPKVGEAISETQGWHGSGASVWICTAVRSGSLDTAVHTAGLLRGYSGSIFSYYGYSYSSEQNYTTDDRALKDSYYTKPWASRAIMVCGEGI